MSKPWNGELPEEEEEYIEVKDPQTIRAIRSAEEEKVKAHEASILKIIDQKQTQSSPPTQVPINKPRFIQDDRERVHVKQQPVTQQKSKPESRKDSKEQSSKKRQDERKPQFKEKKQQYMSKEPQHFTENGHTSNKKPVYKQKKVDKPTRESDKQQPKKKYVEKIRKLKRRKQKYVQQGIDMEIEMVSDDEVFQNQIYVGKRDVGAYLEEAKNRIQNFDFIVLKSFAIYVNKAFLVAGLMANEFPQLKQINIPGNIKVKVHGNNTSESKTKGAIRIQLSLNSLDSHHMGYQEVSKSSILPKEEKVYSEKREVPKKYQEKKPSYVQKEKRRYNEKREDYSDDDRGYR